MAMDSVERIREAEQAAQRLLGEAHAKAQEIITEAQKKAKEQREEMLSAARAAADEALELSRENGKKLLEDDGRKYEEQCERVRAEAEKKRGEAIKLVIDRITG